MTKSKSKKNNIKYGGIISDVSNTILYKHIIIFLYILLCICVSYYIKVIIADDYTIFLLDYVYSRRNQLICGNSPIEKNTVRYTMSTLLTPENSNMKDVLYYILLVIFISFVYMLVYLFGSNIEFLKPFSDSQTYVTNIFIIITMMCAIGFRNNYLKIQNVEDIKLYNTNVSNILNSTLLPKPPPIDTSISTNTDNFFAGKIVDSNNVNNTQIEGLYTKLLSRIMYVDNLNSFQDAINKWNGFKSNADIYPYLVLTNNTTNNITPETVIAKEYYNIWIKELNNNDVLKNSTAPVSYTNSIIYNIDIYNEKDSLETSTSTLSNILVIKYINIDSCTIDYSTKPLIIPDNCTSNITNIPTALTKNIVTYVNENILPFLNSADNIKNKVNNTPSTINGITTHFEVLIGTQNVNNDYTILYNVAQQIPNNTKLLNSLYWLSNLSNGNPSEDINSIMDLNTKLYYIVNVLISYLPFHFAYKIYSSFTLTIIIVLIWVIIPVFIIRLYFSYKTLDAYNKQFNQAYNTTSAKISSTLSNIVIMVVVLAIILFIFYSI